MNSDSAPNREGEINEWMKAYGNDILRLCYLYLSDLHLAEDALQEAFLKAYIHHADFRGGSSPKTWLTSIALNCCKSLRRGTWFRLTDRHASLDAMPDVGEFMPQPDHTVVSEIGKLPDKLKQVVILFYYEELKQKEIAELLHITETAVSVRLTRARAKLKNNLKGWYEHELAEERD